MAWGGFRTCAARGHGFDYEFCTLRECEAIQLKVNLNQKVIFQLSDNDRYTLANPQSGGTEKSRVINQPSQSPGCNPNKMLFGEIGSGQLIYIHTVATLLGTPCQTWVGFKTFVFRTALILAV